MTEEQLKLFEKRPPAPYCRQEFYWRGGDPLKEQEFLREEYKKALADLRVAQQQLQQVQSDVNDANDVLREREGYTRALSSYLERDVSLSTREIAMKEQLADLEKQIAEHQEQLNKVRALQNPAAAAALAKERGYYMIEIQRGQKAIQNNVELENEAKRQMAACTVNGKYRKAVALEHELKTVTAKRNHLRQLVQKTKINFEAMRPVSSRQDPESRRERTALSKNSKNSILLLRLQERKRTRGPKYEAHLNNLLDQVAELNERMCEIGLEDETVDVDALRERVFREGDDEEEEKLSEKSSSGRSSSSDSKKSHSSSEEEKKELSEVRSRSGKEYSTRTNSRNESEKKELSEVRSRSGKEYSTRTNSRNESEKKESSSDREEEKKMSEKSSAKSVPALVRSLELGQRARIGETEVIVPACCYESEKKQSGSEHESENPKSSFPMVIRSYRATLVHRTQTMLLSAFPSLIWKTNMDR